MIFKSLVVGELEVNCYILAEAKNRKALIIDPGDEAEKISGLLEKHRLIPGLVVNTHGHFDHIGADDFFGVAVYIHAADRKMLLSPEDNFSAFSGSGLSVKGRIKTLQDKEIVALEGIELEVIHLPGHSPGGIALLLKKPRTGILFTGDSLFNQGIGRSDLGGDEGLLIKGIKERLFVLPDETKIYPGHGPSSTIGAEKTNNPFLR
jgi:glyoxylase-like metal-dependent hydrolase (beta-lactamase superfamily II)